ncbi:MAG TPA: transcription termination/antitermination NusG family protein, partial [Spirochaetota bacterium]|nr:transcription termination/antitermination NusG family protein [Spirochaetota bacterium]
MGNNWYAVYVRSRHEFMVEAALAHKSLQTFLPAVERLRQWKDRKKKIMFPLFPGYLFVQCNGDAEHFLAVLKTKGV